MPFIPAANPGKLPASARSRQDLSLVQAALAGQQSGYADLLERYHKSVLNVSWKMVRDEAQAQDLTMEAFSKAFRHLERYRPAYAFSTWLFRIATNHCLDYLRRQKLATISLSAGGTDRAGDAYLLEVSTPDPDPQEVFVRQQRREAVHRAVAQLSDRYRRLVELRYFEEWSYEEIALDQQLPLGTVKAQLYRARELLLGLLHEHPTL